jgi:multiple sugar transport system substrate-binding protein
LLQLLVNKEKGRAIMKISKNTFTCLLSILLTAVLLLSACSSSGGTKDPAATQAPTVKPAESQASASKPANISVTAWGDPAVEVVFKKIVEQFNEKNKGKIAADLQIIPKDYDTKLTTMVAGNETPDIAQMESASLAFPLADQGKFLDLLPLIKADPDLKIEDLSPLHGYYSDKGELFGLNAERETFMMYYNVDMFKDAGIAPPPSNPQDAWDWDTFVNIAKKMTLDQAGNDATSAKFDPTKIKQYGVDFGKWWGLWGNFVFSNDGDFVSKDGKEFGLSKPEAAEALQKLADLINVYHVAPSPTQSKSLPGGVNSLKTKKVAMLFDGQWMNLQFGTDGMNYNVAVLPKMKNPVTMVVSGTFSIFKSTKNPPEAWEVLKALVNPETPSDLLINGVWLPANRSWYTDPAALKIWTGNKYHPAGFSGQLDMMLNHSVPTPTAYVKNFSKIMDLVNPALDKVFLGEEKALDAMKRIEPKVLEIGIGRRDVKM